MTGQRKPRKNAPYKWFYLSQVYHSFSEPAHGTIYRLSFSFLPSTLLVSLLSICLCKFIYTKSEVQGLVTVYWPSRPSTWDSELSMPQSHFNLCSGNQNPFSSLCRLRPPEIKRYITSYNEQPYILQQQLLKITTLELVKMSFLTIKTLYILMKILLIFSPCPTFYFIYSNSNE